MFNRATYFTSDPKIVSEGGLECLIGTSLGNYRRIYASSLSGIKIFLIFFYHTSRSFQSTPDSDLSPKMITSIIKLSFDVEVRSKDLE